jgi:acetyl esterase/lipase
MDITVTRDVPCTDPAEATQQLLDVYQPLTDGPAPVALLWHGSTPDEKDVLAPLAEEVARHGLVVFVPNWNPAAPDRGRSQLLASLRHLRSRAAHYNGDADRSVVAGWSAGAGAAVGLALAPRPADDWSPLAVVGLAGRYDVPARSTGTVPLDDVKGPASRATPVHLVHGTQDVTLSGVYSRHLLDALEQAGRPVTLAEPDTDHAGVVMTEFDPALGRCRPTRSEHAVRAGQQTARILAQAVSSTP